MLYGACAARLADWSIAIPGADEGLRLAIECGEPMWEAGADIVAATIAGMRGDAEAAEAAADASAARKAEESAAQSERLPGATPAVGRPSWDAPAGAGPR